MSLVVGSTESHGGQPEKGQSTGRTAGKPSPPKPVGHGPRNMPSKTVQCTHCGVVLNLPEKVEGRRLKCPKCGERFHVGSGPAGDKAVASPNDQHSGNNNDPDSSLLLSSRSSLGDLPVMPTNGGGNLGETFELPLLSDPETPSRPAATPPGAAGGGEAADALALFDDSPKPRRKKTGAEARASARRCDCGGVVPVGMSICQRCGLDLDTGARVDLADDLSPPPPPPPPGPTIIMSVIGSLCAATALALAGFATYEWNRGVSGAIYFIPIALFGIYAALQFLRGKTAKLLLVALALGALVDLTFMIGAPIINAMNETAPVERQLSPNDDAELEREIIKPYAERLDTDPIFKGIALLFVYAGVSIYLISPGVQQHMRRV